MEDKKVLSLFSSAGIGELGVKAAEMSILVSNELLQNRCKLYSENYPGVDSICEDIWEKEDEIIEKWRKKTSENPFLIYATPPCQGMCSIGVGKLLSEIKKGNRKPGDHRNRLIIPTLHIVNKLKTEWLLLENVATMHYTIIEDEDGNYVNIIDYIHKQLGDEYEGKRKLLIVPIMELPK